MKNSKVIINGNYPHVDQIALDIKIPLNGNEVGSDLINNILKDRLLSILPEYSFIVTQYVIHSDTARIMDNCEWIEIKHNCQARMKVLIDLHDIEG